MADTQQRTTKSGGVKELVILVGILLTVIAGAVGTYWIRSRGVESAPGESTRPRTVVRAPPAGVFHGDVYFEYNSVLAQRRAQAVKQFLVELGVPETSIRLVTLGQDGSLCDDPGKECQELNRRVHLEFRKLAAAAPSTLAVAGASANDRAQADSTSPAGAR